jgi:small-conductance mechanosensitive channel
MANQTVVVESATQGANFINSLISSDFGMNLILAVLVLLVGLVIGRIAGRFVYKILKELEIDRFLRQSGIKNIELEVFFGKLVSYLIYFVAFLISLDQLGIRVFVLYFIAIVILILVLLSVFLYVKDFIPNILSGFYIWRHNLFGSGKNFSVNGIEGRVSSGFLDTRLRTRSGDLVVIPNSGIKKSSVVRLVRR